MGVPLVSSQNGIENDRGCKGLSRKITSGRQEGCGLLICVVRT